MTYPSYPSPTGPSEQPGWYPLRPLGVGEVIGAGLRVAIRHLAVLAPIAFVVSLLGAVVNVLVLAGNGSLRGYASGDLARLPADATQSQVQDYLHQFYTAVLPALAASALVGLILAPVLAGVATPFAAAAATTRTGSNATGLGRLRGRWPVLIAVAVAAGLAESLGYLLLIVPGIIIWLMLLPAGPVAAMEGLGIKDTLRRAVVISKGFKGRLFGIQLLMGLIVGAIALAVDSILGHLVGGDDPVVRFILLQVLSAVVSAVLVPWSSAVTAMLYIDIRIRREGLAQALLAASRPSYWS